MPTPPAAQNLISIATIERQILVLRGHRVMLDRDLAEIYGVKLKRLNEQVKRNRDRFPDDFMFQLKLEEGKLVIRSRSQIATLKRGENVKYRPHVFTEHGAVMLANVLRSPVAVRASIQVVRAFVNLRRILTTHEDLAHKVEAIERRVGKHDVELQDRTWWTEPGGQNLEPGDRRNVSSFQSPSFQGAASQPVSGATRGRTSRPRYLT